MFINGTPYLNWRGTAPQPRAFLAGQISRFIWLAAQGPTGVFAIRFHPHGLRRFTPTPICEFTNLEVELDHVWPEAPAFTERIGTAVSFDARCQLANAFFLELLAKQDTQTDPLIAHWLTRNTPRDTRVAALAQQSGLSVRQLERRFRTHIGLTPKRFARILRLQRLVTRLATQPIENLTALAYELGFADHAHMTRDFKQLSGLTPSQYMHEQHLFLHGS